MRQLLATVLLVGCSGADFAVNSGTPNDDTGTPAEVGADTGTVPDVGSDGTPLAPPGMVSVPGGHFNMGCVGIDTNCESDELPYPSVVPSAYFIDKTEVTQNEYAGCISAGGGCGTPSCEWPPSPATGNNPVVCVSYTDATNFCAFRKRRLPTEAEWEKAARGTDGAIYPWGNAPPTCTLTTFPGGCGSTSRPVGSTPAGNSPYGAQDMAGNVWEWVADWHSPAYYGISPASDPKGPATGVQRVIRSGAFEGDVRWIRSSNRWTRTPDARERILGFRCALSP